MVDFRFVIPVTTASGNSAGTAGGLDGGVADGEPDGVPAADWLVDGNVPEDEGCGLGFRLMQPATRERSMTSEAARAAGVMRTALS